MTAVMDGGQPAIRATESSDDSGVYLDPDVNFTAQVGDIFRFEADVKAQLIDHAALMRLRIGTYNGAAISWGGAVQPIPAGKWTRLSVEGTVTEAPPGHYFRALVWPSLTTGSPEGAWIQVRRAMVQIAPAVGTDSVFRDGATTGWAWEGSPHTSASFGPLEPYSPDGVLDVGGQRLDWLDAIADLEETAESHSAVLTTLNTTGVRHHVSVRPAGPATGRLTLHFIRELGTGDPGARAQVVANSLLSGAVHRLTYAADLSGATAFDFVPTGAVTRRLEKETAYRKRQAVWTVEVDYTKAVAS